MKISCDSCLDLCGSRCTDFVSQFYTIYGDKLEGSLFFFLYNVNSTSDSSATIRLEKVFD